MLLTKEVNIKPNGKVINHYRNKGYDVKLNELIKVKIEDLTKGSHIKVDVLCDYCQENICHIPYYSYLERIKTIGKYSCKSCYGQKFKESNLVIYGVENPSQLLDTREKVKQTCLERYGVENYSSTTECREKVSKTNLEKFGTIAPMKNVEIQEKSKKTCLEKYGVPYSFQSEEVKNKIKQTSLEKYGTITPAQTEEVKKKIIKTNLDRYGVEYTLQVPSIREKGVKSLYQKGICPTSNQQLYLHHLFGGEINYPISHYNVDICFPKEKLVIEYDGGGHNLLVKTHKITQEEYKQKELIRSILIKQEGYNQIHIISSKDKLPSDKILFQMLDYAREYFNTTNHTWIEYNIDISIMRNAENKEGITYNYGELRRI